MFKCLVPPEINGIRIPEVKVQKKNAFQKIPRMTPLTFKTHSSWSYLLNISKYTFVYADVHFAFALEESQ